MWRWTRAAASLRRHYPVRFRRSVARALWPATLSARLARAPVWFASDVTSQRRSGDRAVAGGGQRAGRLANWAQAAVQRPVMGGPLPGRDRWRTDLAGPGGAMPGKGARGGADMRRAAAALLLVAVAALGLRAGGAFSAAGSPEILGLSGRTVYWIIASAELVMALAGIALLILRMIWARKSGRPLQRQRRSIWWLLLLPLAAFGLSKILQRLRQQHAVAARAGHAHAAGANTGAAGHLHVGNPWPLLVLFVVVALGVAALTVYRRRQRHRMPLPPPEAD